MKVVQTCAHRRNFRLGKVSLKYVLELDLNNKINLFNNTKRDYTARFFYKKR